jgi:hypothetical protein
MKKTKIIQSLVALVVYILFTACDSEQIRRISVDEYRSKMKAGWGAS